MSKKTFFLFFLFSTIAFFGLLFSFKNDKDAQMIKFKRLDNGLKLLVKKNPSNEIVAMEFFMGGGSSVEKREEAGLTYLTNRLLFKGTKDKDFAQIARAFDSLGAIWGLSVERDFSEVSLVVPKKYWRESLKLLAEILSHPGFNQEEIEKEKRIMLEQIKNIEDNPFENTYRAFNEKIYGNHPYAKPTFGYPETVAKFSREDIINHYRKFMCTGNILAAVVGNLEPEEVFSSIKENFKDLPSGEKLYMNNPVIQSREKRAIIEKSGLKQAMILLGFRAVPVQSEDYPALKLISSLMGEGMSSRLFENIRDRKGIGYSIGTFFPTRLATSPFVFYLGVQPERVKEAETAFWEEIDKLKYEKIAPEEFKKAKNFLVGNFYLAQQRNKDQAYLLGWFETIGLGYDYAPKYLARVKNLEISQIEKVAKKYFDKEKAFLTVLRPGKSN